MSERNSPCPCGSGKKYKKCCLLVDQSHSDISKPKNESTKTRSSLRIKGGVRYDPESQGYRAIVHMWDNAESIGDPEEIIHPQVFDTEDAAMDFYKSNMRPSLEALKTETGKGRLIQSIKHRKLEK